jgi:hypothetical protein
MDDPLRDKTTAVAVTRGRNHRFCADVSIQTHYQAEHDATKIPEHMTMI